MKNTQTPSVAIIGHGTIGKAHRNTLLEYQSSRKVGPIYSIDSNPAQLVGQDHSLTAGSLEELTSRGVAPDVVLIAANTAMRKDNYHQLLTYAHKLPVEARPSLFVEKPIADMNHDIGMMQADFNALGYGSKVPLAFAYLIRSSKAVDAAVEPLKKAVSSSNGILQADIAWQKLRDAKRITPGVHIDESTHGLDTALYLLEQAGVDVSKIKPYEILPTRNSDLPLDKINTFFNLAQQIQTYGANHNPLAAVEYAFDLSSNYQGLISGSSSFVQAPQKRSVAISTCNKDGSVKGLHTETLRITFDTPQGDTVEQFDDDELVAQSFYKQSNLIDSKIGREWGHMLDYHKTGVRNPALCSLDEAVRDLNITKMLDTPFNHASKWQ